MKQITQLEKMGATPGKLALIAVLASVLVFVIVRQLPSRGSGQSSSTQVQAHARATEEVSQEPQQALVTESEEAELPWPPLDMIELLAIDPFSTPSWAVQPETDADQTEATDLVQLQKQGVSVVMITEEGKTASIGERNVHVGDVLEGYQITDITAQGIVVHKLSSQ